MKIKLLQVWKSNSNKTDSNNTDMSETYPFLSGESEESNEYDRYRAYFENRLELPILKQGYPYDTEVLDEIHELLIEAVMSSKAFLRICGEEKPKEVVKSRLMKLDSSHIQYVLECMKNNTTHIRNIKQYLLAALYNAPTTMDSYYVAQVRHDFGFGGVVNKKA